MLYIHAIERMESIMSKKLSSTVKIFTLIPAFIIFILALSACSSEGTDPETPVLTVGVRAEENDDNIAGGSINIAQGARQQFTATLLQDGTPVTPDPTFNWEIVANTGNATQRNALATQVPGATVTNDGLVELALEVPGANGSLRLNVTTTFDGQTVNAYVIINVTGTETDSLPTINEVPPQIAGTNVQMATTGGAVRDWEIVTGGVTGTSINPTTGLLTIGITQTGPITVGATSVAHGLPVADRIVEMTAVPLPIINEIPPQIAGTSVQMTTTGGAVRDWRIVSGTGAGTAIDEMTGLLTIGINQTGPITVGATSVAHELPVADRVVEITAVPLPIINEIPSQVAGTSIQMTTTGGAVRNWQIVSGTGAGTAIDEMTGLLTIGINQTGPITVGATSVAHELPVATHTVEVTAVPLPTINAVPPQATGTGVQMTTTGGIVRDWRIVSGIETGTSIDETTGLLTIGINQTGSITVGATSVAHGLPVTNRMVEVTETPVPLTINEVPPQVAGTSVQMTTTGGAVRDWRIVSVAGAGTTIDEATGLLTIGINQTGSITVTATSIADGTPVANRIVQVTAVPLPTINAILTQLAGTSVQMTTTGGAVTDWRIVSGAGAGTSINATGLLTVGINQIGPITVGATSVAHGIPVANRIVQVTAVPLPTINAVPNQLAGTNVQMITTGGAVTDWQIVSGAGAGTSINATGLLTIGINQIGPITVGATSVAHGIPAANRLVQVTAVPLPTISAVLPQFAGTSVQMATTSGAVRDWQIISGAGAGTSINSETGLLTISADQTGIIAIGATSVAHGIPVVNRIVELLTIPNTAHATFQDPQTGTRWRVLLPDDGSGNALIITEYVHILNTRYHSNMGFTLFQSAEASTNVRNWWNNARFNEPNAVGVNLRSRALNYEFQNESGGAIPRTSSATGAGIEVDRVAGSSNNPNFVVPNNTNVQRGHTRPLAPGVGTPEPFILSTSEANYYFNGNTGPQGRQTQQFNATSSNANWWLRSPGGSNSVAVGRHAAVFDNGLINHSTGTSTVANTFPNVGLRPALWVRR